MDKTLAAAIRGELGAFVEAAGTRRSLGTTCHVGHPGEPHARWAHDVTTDHSLRTDLVERAIDGLLDTEGACAWITRGGELDVSDADAEWFAAARTAFARHGLVLITPVEREAVLTGLGRAQYWMSSPAEAWISLAGAATSAVDRGDAVSAARILLIISERAIWTWRDYGESVPAAIELWERLLARIPASEPVLRAQVQAALAIELLYHPDSADRATRLVDEAVRAARCTDSPSDLSRVLQLAHLAIQRPDLLDRRVAITDELVILAGRLDDAAGLAGALCKRAVDRAESGSWQQAIADVRRAHRLAEQHQLVPVLIIAGAALALARQAAGDFAGAEAEIERLETLQSTVSMAPFGLGLVQLATMRLVQGRIAELEPALRQAVGQQPVFRDLHGLALIACSGPGEARMMLGDWAEQRPLLWDYLWPGLTVVRARLWLELGDRRAIAELREQLTPYAGRLVIGGMGAFFLGSVSHTVGELALAAGDREAAVGHLRHALDTHRRLGFEPFAAATEALLDRAVGR